MPEELFSDETALVYFIQAGGPTGPIKIGLAIDPERRLRELQTAHAEKLHLLVASPGGREFETALHRSFSHLRIRGEWFRYDGELRDMLSYALDAIWDDAFEGGDPDGA